MSFFDVFSEMLVILFCMAAGFLAHKLGYLSKQTDQNLCRLLLGIIVPCLILGSVSAGDTLPSTEEILSVLKVAIVYYGLGFCAATFVPHLLGGTVKQQCVWRYSLTFSNMAFNGYPVSVALFGQEALFYAVILVLPFNLLSYSLGPLMLAGQAKFRWQQLLSPCIVASVIALMVALFHINMPALLGECLNFTGSLTTPLSLLLVGSLLADLPFGRAFTSPRLWALAAFRLLILPIMLWLLLKWTGIGTPLVANIAVILMAMPTALNGSMLAMEYGGDTECMAQSIFLTTLMSIITIPVLAALL